MIDESSSRRSSGVSSSGVVSIESVLSEDLQQTPDQNLTLALSNEEFEAFKDIMRRSGRRLKYFYDEKAQELIIYELHINQEHGRAAGFFSTALSAYNMRCGPDELSPILSNNESSIPTQAHPEAIPDYYSCQVYQRPCPNLAMEMGNFEDPRSHWRKCV